jgi:nucleoside-diphosphate-sugar epimerase
MSVLITGASGFLGGAVVERLLAHGERQLRCFIRPSSNIARLQELQAAYPSASLEFVKGNLTSERDACRALDGIKTVYHLAAKMRGAPATVFLNTVVASKRLLEAARETRPRRIVLVSSLSVYGTSQLPCGRPIDETFELEQHPEKRDVYSHAKLRQELLFHEYEDRGGFELVILRPGSVYGIGGKNFSARVGIEVQGWLLRFGRKNLLPLTYLDNCAEAVILAGTRAAAGGIYNVIDDDLPTSAEYVNAYRRSVERLRSISVPFFITMALSSLAEKYQAYSQQQLPALLTPYKSASLWRGHRFSNQKAKSMGWQQIVPTQEAVRRTFEYLDHQRAHSGQSTSPLCRHPLSQVVRENPSAGVALETRS